MNDDTDDPTGAVVLVVDDQPANRELLHDLLVSRGFEVREAADGQEALTVLQEQELPDVILLDVVMPGLDGFEVCRRIRDNPIARHIPIIMVTGLSDRASRLRGISEGATDFLSKPIDIFETHMRVRNAAQTKRLYDCLTQKNRLLREAEQSRDSLVQMIVHDLKSPLTSVIGYCKLLRNLGKERMDEQQAELLTRSIVSGQHTLDMVDSILSVSRLEAGQLILKREPTSVDALLGEVEAWVRPSVREGMSLEFGDATGLMVDCDATLLRRVLANLVENAMRFADFRAGRVSVAASGTAEGVEFSVSDNGKGIPPAARVEVFDKFSQGAHTSHRNYGLGLAFCRLAVEHHGGTIWIEDAPDCGSIFRFTIPL